MVIFLVGSVWLGRTIRRIPHKVIAEKASRTSHLLFWLTLVLPGVVGFFYPCLTRYDALLGTPSLPLRPLWLVFGSVLLLIGLGLTAASNRYLIKLGRGSPAFLLTEQLVRSGIYKQTRNPMSLGFYLTCISIGMIAGSLVILLGVLLILLPIHIFNLKYFEERELELRYGPSYISYKQRIPFLMPRIRYKGDISTFFIEENIL